MLRSVLVCNHVALNARGTCVGHKGAKAVMECENEWLFAGTNVLNLQLHFTAFMAIFFDGVADVESATRLDVAGLRTLSEGDAVHDRVGLVVHQLEFDVFLSATDYFGGAIVVDAVRAEEGTLIARTEGCEFA